MKLVQLLPFAALATAQKGGASGLTFSETPKAAVSFGISIPKGGGKDFIGRIVRWLSNKAVADRGFRAATPRAAAGQASGSASGSCRAATCCVRAPIDARPLSG